MGPFLARTRRALTLVCRSILLLLSVYLPSLVQAASEGEAHSLTFVSLSDFHISRTSEDAFVLSRSAETILKDLVSQITTRTDVRFVTVLGDLVADADSGDLEVVRKILDGLTVPYYVIAGNHDRPVPRSRKRVSPARVQKQRSFEEVFQGHGPEPGKRYWSANPLPGLHLVGLDTTIAGNWGGRLDKAQLEWLEKDLERHNHMRTIVLSHHCLIEVHPWDRRGAWKNYVLENAESVRSMLRRHENVVLVLSGHHHLSGATTLDGIHYITCPSIASWPCRYTVCTLSETTLTCSTHPAVRAELVQKAWHNLLAFSPIRNRFPAGIQGEDEMARVFMGPQYLELPLRGKKRSGELTP